MIPRREKAAFRPATIRTATLFSVDGAAIPVSTTRLANQIVSAMLIFRFKVVLTPLLPAALVLGGGVYTAMRASGPAQPAAKDGREAVIPQGQTRGLVADQSLSQDPNNRKKPREKTVSAAATPRHIF